MTVDHFTTAFEINQHGLPAELALVVVGRGDKVMLLLDNVGLYVAQDVSRRS
jgi:hypothetical protein